MDRKSHIYRATPRRESTRRLSLLPWALYERHRKMLRASPSTILEWIRKFGGEHAKPPEPDKTEAVVIELDEMWHYVKKNKQTLDMESFVS